MNTPVCAVIGAGAGNGAAFGRRFAAAGYRVALCARNLERLAELTSSIPDAGAYQYDVTDVAAPASIFSRIRAELGPVETLIYNAGAGQFANIDQATVETFQGAWEVNARGLFTAVQAVLPDMRAAGRGQIIVIGATASLKGGANFVPFAAAKSAQRSLAQSLARHLGPEGIHVAYVIVDGVIDLARTRARMPDKPDEFFMQPDAIAEAVFFLTRQAKTAWTFELDLRPFGEHW